jgi:hypothetical protein
MFCLNLFYYFSVNSKRQAGTNQRIINLFVQYLVVLDSTVYKDFSQLYGNLSPDLMNQYIKIYFSQIVNGVRNQKVKNTKQN